MGNNSKTIIGIIVGVLVLCTCICICVGGWIVLQISGKPLQETKIKDSPEEANALTEKCIPTSDFACFTIEARDPYDANMPVPGITISFTRSDDGRSIFSGVTNSRGEVEFLVPLRPVYYDFVISGYPDGSSCGESFNSVGQGATYVFMWLQPANPGGNGSCHYGNDR
jgi:hypothetical protein